MSEKPKSTILEKYHRAISALPLDEQLERQQNIRSPKTLRRMLSDKAPMQLAARFGHRIKEVAGLGLSSYEQARILYTQEKTSEAKKKYEAALKAKDLRGHLGLGELGLSANTPESDAEAIKHLETALKNGHGTYETHLELGMLYYRCEQDQQADKQFKLAVEKSPDPQTVTKYLEGLQNAMGGNAEAGFEALDSAAQKGLSFAIRILIVYYREIKDYESVKKYAEIAIKYGETKLYLKLGQHFLNESNNDEAEKAYRSAVKAGHMEACAPLTQLILEKNGTGTGASEAEGEAKALCEKAIASGEPAGYIGMANLLAKQGKDKEATDYLLQSLKAGANLPASVVIFTLCQFGRFEEAIKFCQEKVAKEPKLHFFLCIAYGEMGNKAESARQMQLAINKNIPRHEIMAVENLKRKGRDTEAQMLFAKIVAAAMNDMGMPQGLLETITWEEVKSRMN